MSQYKKMMIAGAIASVAFMSAAQNAAAQADGTCNVDFVLYFWCNAPIGAGGATSYRWDTAAYVGLQWNFGDRNPELVLGIRRTRTDSNGSVVGGKLDAAFNFLQPTDLKPVLRALVVAGRPAVQGEAGLGIRIPDGQLVMGVGVQAPYINVGANYFLNDGWKAYAGLNSLRALKVPGSNGGAPTCGADDKLIAVTNGTMNYGGGIVAVPTQYVKYGYTCVTTGME